MNFPDWCQEAYDALESGKMVWVKGKAFKVCATCYHVVCVNKRLFGSLHICAKKG